MAIYSTSRTLGNLVKGRRIEIPPIQRDYAWSAAESAGQLWNDLITFHKFGDKESSYYLGNLIAWADADDPEIEIDDDSLVWELLDGQQRLTSLTMILNAIWAELNQVENDTCEEICQEIITDFLFADENRFAIDVVRSSLHPRRQESRDFLLWLIQNMSDGLPSDYNLFNSDNNMHQVALIYHLYIKGIMKDEGVDGLIAFYFTLRDRIILGITLTDDLSMGFQMFQTANARGTPLTSYDMFRAFSIKRAKVNLNLGASSVDKIVRSLNRVERILTKFGDSDKKRESETKAVMTAWTSCRTGAHFTKNQIVKRLETDIEMMNSFADLSETIEDLRINANIWEGFKTRTPAKREDADEKAWRIIGRFELIGFTMHWPLTLALRTAQDELDWDDNVVESYLSIIEWAVVKSVSCTGLKLGGKTNRFQQGIPIDCNYVWNSYRGNPGGLTESVFHDRAKYWLEDQANSANPNGFALVFKTRFTEINYIKSILHLIDTGLGDSNPWGSGQQVHVVKLFEPYESNFSRISQELSEHIGNYFLIRGPKKNGWTQAQINTFTKSKDLDHKLRCIKTLSSQDEINSIAAIRDKSDIRGFIMNRSKAIQRRLEEGYNEALNYTPSI